jgi:hypothetical protein
MNDNTRECLKDFIDRLLKSVSFCDKYSKLTPDEVGQMAKELNGSAEELKDQLDKDETILS